MRFARFVRDMKRYLGKVFAVSRIFKNQHFAHLPHLHRFRQIDCIDLAITTKYIFIILVTDAKM
ncbi:hypothetical protein FD63_08485 [Xanthomonas translucens pv. undulosa]|nr:hypothetical protein FD63_08485 [Xanthomonas translucens pv. undulosa]